LGTVRAILNYNCVFLIDVLSDVPY